MFDIQNYHKTYLEKKRNEMRERKNIILNIKDEIRDEREQIYLPLQKSNTN